MSISTRSRSLRASAKDAPKRRGISLDREAEPLGPPDDSATATGMDTRSRPGPTGPDGRPFADAQTLRDLDLFAGTPDEPSLFGLLDRTRTAGGRKALADILTGGRIDRQTIERRQEAIRYFVDPGARERWALRSSDRSVGYLERYLASYVHPLTGMRGPVYWLRALWYRASYGKYFEYLDTCIRTLHRFVRTLHEARTAQDGELPMEIALCRSSIDRLLGDELVIEFRRAGGRYNRFRPAQMLHFDEKFRRELTPLIHEAIDAVHRIDLFVALGQVAEELALTFPNFRSDSQPKLICEDLHHPFLAHPVANDLRLDAEQGFLFLTGPNMAGKTTLMKALGLAVYMAHVGLPVPCRRMDLTLFDGLLSSLSIEDNLGKGYSFFYAEVRRVKDVAEALHDGRHLLVLFDELFKGTNLKDALDGSRLVVSGFRRFTGSFFVLSSHLLELGEELVELGDDHGSPADIRASVASDGAQEGADSEAEVPIRFLRFDAEVENGRPSFSYRLSEGVSRERLGMLILRNEGIPELLQPRPPEAGGCGPKI